jgi:radical SAM enzyme (TIGR01210 family)
MVSVDNSGSLFDYKTINKYSLEKLYEYIIGQIPNDCAVCLESRVDLIDIPLLSKFRSKYNRKIWLQIGFETFNEEIRNNILNKRFSNNQFENIIKKLQKIITGYSFFILIKGSYLHNEEDGLKDAMETIDYLSSIKEKYNFDLLIRANSMFLVENTIWGENAKRHEWQPPTILTLAKVTKYAIKKGIKINLGLSEEGETSLEYTFWTHPESTNFLYTKLYEINHTQSLEQVDFIIEKYGQEIDNRNPNDKFITYNVFQ